MRSPIVLLVLFGSVALSACDYFHGSQERAMIEQISHGLESPGQLGKEIAAVRLSAATLQSLEKPNLLVEIKSTDVTALIGQAAKGEISVPAGGEFSKLTLKPTRVEFAKARIGFEFVYDASLKSVPLSFAGTAVVYSTLALNGSAAAVMPLFSQVSSNP